MQLKFTIRQSQVCTYFLTIITTNFYDYHRKQCYLERQRLAKSLFLVCTATTCQGCPSSKKGKP